MFGRSVPGAALADLDAHPLTASMLVDVAPVRFCMPYGKKFLDIQ